MIEQGYIKLFRSLLKWEWYDDINATRLFIHLLLTVNHKDEKWHGFVVERGSRITSYGKLAKETGLSVKQIRTSLSKLIGTGEVASKTSNKFSIISISNYDLFQDQDKQRASKGQAKGKQRATKEESKKARSKEQEIKISEEKRKRK